MEIFALLELVRVLKGGAVPQLLKSPSLSKKPFREETVTFPERHQSALA